MKNYVKTVCYMIAVSLCLSCSQGKGKKFNPQEREQTFVSEGERQRARERKRAELDSLQLDTEPRVFENNIKLTVLPPAPNGDITMGTSKAVAAKMMQITAQNGIGGCGNSPAFCLATIFTPTG